MKIKLSILLFCCVFAVTIYGQTVAEISKDSARNELQRIRNFYKFNGHIELAMDSQLKLSDTTTNEPLDTLNGIYHVLDSMCYVEFGDKIYLRNKRWFISVLKDVREIYIDSVKNIGAWDTKSNPMQSADSLVMESASGFINLVTAGSDIIGIRMNFDTSSANEANELKIFESTIFYNKITKEISHCQYKMQIQDELLKQQFSTKHYVITVHYKYFVKSLEDTGVFSESQFIKLVGSNWVTTPEYEGYRIIKN